MATGGKEHREFISLLHTETVYGHVGQRGIFRIACQHQPQTEERARINRRVGWGREQLTQVKVRVVGIEDLLLAWCLRGRDHHRRNRVCHRLTDVLRQLRGFAPQQQCRSFPAGVHPYQNAGAGVALHAIEHHGRARAGGAFYGTARADMAVHACQFRIGIYRVIGFDIVTLMALQQRDGASEIVDWVLHVFLP